MSLKALAASVASLALLAAGASCAAPDREPGGIPGIAASWAAVERAWEALCWESALANGAAAGAAAGENGIGAARNGAIGAIAVGENAAGAIDGNGICKNRLVELIDEFHGRVLAFIDSEMYGIYLFTLPADRLALYRRYWFVPALRGHAAGGQRPEGLPEIHGLAGLALSFRSAVLDIGAAMDGGTVTNGAGALSGAEDAARISADISSVVLRALMREGEMQRFVGDVVFRLLLVLIAFIASAIVGIQFLRKALARSRGRASESSAFSRAVLMGQEEERKRISRELHDTVAQDLHRLSREVDRIDGAEEGEREKIRAEVASLQAALARRVRDICGALVPPDFESRELADSLRQLCFDFGARTGIDCRAEIAHGASLDFLDRDKQLQVFRIAQEALTNIEKHSGATKAAVALGPDAGGGFFVGIGDNGAGFKKPASSRLRALRGPENAPAGGSAHLGIRGMKERAMLLGGALAIERGHGWATYIRLCIPPPPPPEH